jgi:hypothetical protein
MQNTRLERRSSSSSGTGRLLEGPAAWLMTFVLIPGLLVAILLLPPISLLDRLQSFTLERISANTGGAILDPDGTIVNFPAEGVLANFQARLGSVPRADFVEGRAGEDLYTAAQALPDTLISKSPVYQIETRGRDPLQAIVTIPIPNDSLPYETLAVYEWTGELWQNLPARVLPDADVLEARLDYVPKVFMVVQTLPGVPAVTLNLGLEGQLPEGAVVTNEARGVLNLRGDGGLDGQAPPNTGNTVPIITNVEAQTVRTDLINNLLVDVALQETQLATLEQLVVANGYPGLLIDYRGVDAVPSARADYARLIDRVAERLAAHGKSLAVRVEPATPISAEEWNTGGYDWRALSQAAATVVIPAPIDPRAYAAGGELEQLLAYASDEVGPNKLAVELAGYSVERSGNYLLLKGYQEALAPLLGTLAAEAGADNSVSIDLENPRLQGQVQWDEMLGIYSYTYLDDQGMERTVYIETAGSLGRKLDLLRRFNVTNVTIQMPTNGDIDPATLQVLQQFQMGEMTSSAPQAQMAVAYTLYGEDGSVVGQQIRPLESPEVAFPMPEGSGKTLRVDAQLVNANGTALTAPQSALLALAAESAPPPGEQSSVQPTLLSVDQIVNVRSGPSTAFDVLGQISTGQSHRVNGRTSASDWWQIEFNNGNGWVFGQLATVSGASDAVAVVENLPVVAAAPAPAAAPAAAPAPAPEAAPAPAPAPVAAAAAPAPVAAPAGGASFGYGIQVHAVDNGQIFPILDSIGGMGFNWLKQQIEWKRFEADAPGRIDWPGMDEIVSAAGSRGVNVLFSVVNAPGWAREPGFDGSVGGPPQDPQTYANFAGAIAGRFCGTALKAIEVWNEQNLHYEWGNKPLNPGEYVQLLAAAYNSIKTACPAMIVVGGALTPAGNNLPYAMDDFTYLEEMFKAGANSYMDVVGSHPSGYNVPPSVTWEGACEAIQKTGNSFNGACDSPHHSWSFRSTMEGYRNIMSVYGAGNKQIWPTEFGWAAGGAMDPRYRYADDNDYTEQAQWTVEAYQMMKNWGWVGPAFLWNLNFRVVANGTEKAQWGIVDPGWNPLPAYTALAQMPK